MDLNSLTRLCGCLRAFEAKLKMELDGCGKASRLGNGGG